MANCLFCSNQVQTSGWESENEKRWYYTECATCGKFHVSERAHHHLVAEAYLSLEERRILSGGIRERTEAREDVYITDVDAFRASISTPADPLEAIDRLLLHLLRTAPRAGAEATLNLTTDYPLAFAHDADEAVYLLLRARDLGFINWDGQSPARCSIAIEGWRHLRTIKYQVRDTRQAFVAMWFADEMNVAFTDGIVPALTETGYKPLRLDFAEYNEKIDDRIIAEIQKSGLMVADFTGQRGGVYFEAGFALGLKIPVIWTCRFDHAADLHFDTRQYNHILWNDPADLREKLKWRIEATLPRQVD